MCSSAIFLDSIQFNSFFSWHLCPMIVTWLSANLCIIWPSWLTYLLPACRRLLAGWILGDLSSTDLGAAAGFLWLQYHWPLHLWFCSFTANLLHRHQHTRTHELCFSSADAHVHLDVSNPLLLLHPQNNSENPLCPTKKKGLFNLLLPYDCCLNLLWKLHLHVCENLSKGRGCFDKGSSYAQYLCGSYAQSVYLYLTEPAGKTSS